MKKRIISLIALVVLGLMTAFAQVPTTPLTYQTVVRNAQNQLVINQENVTVTVSVWNGAGTSELYRETHSGLSTNANGLLTLMMGTGTVNLGTWGDIDWSDASIKTTVSYNPGDGTVTINSAPAPVTAVPYAIQAGNAIPQVQSNWTEADNTQASFIQNKPNLATVATSGDYNDLTNRPTIPDAQVNADWNATSGVSQILNKPDLSVYATNEALNTFQTQTNNTLTGINSNITNLQSQITSNDQDIAALQQNDVTINNRITTDIAALQQNDVTINNRITTDSAALHNALIDTAAAIRGDIHNATLTIQTNGTTTGTFTANQATNATINIDVPAAQVQSNWTEADNTQASFIQNKPTLATVATSGDYNDLSNQPAINNATLTIKQGETTLGTFTANASEAATITVPTPTAQVQSNWTEGDNTQASFIQNKPTLATVATSGSYNDLSDQPAINNATLTIKQGETTLGTFTANASEAATITVPTPDAQVQSNWAESDNTSAAYIQNKPAINDATLTIKQGETSLGTFTANASEAATITVPTPDAQVQSNWAESDNTSAAYIQNKPAINDGKLIVTYGTESPVIFTANQAGNTAVTIPAPAAQVQADWAETTTTSASYIQHKPTLATVATSGNYNDLSNTPAINNATLTIKQGLSELGTFTANAGTDVTINVPEPVAQVQANWNENDNTQASFIQNKPAINNATLTIKQGETTLGTFTANASEAATITVPTPAAQVQANWTEADNTQASFIQNKPTLATVATSGSYNDLSDQPAINDATLTIQKNGTEVGTFTANQASAATINVTVPTTVAELTDAGDYATLAGDNHFTGANDFTAGSITVPNAITDFDAALTNPCTQDAVSLCDLLDVYNRLNERIAYLEAVVSSVVESLDVPTVTTSQASSVSASKAIVGGVLVSAGSATVAERGLCYSTSNDNPSITDTKQSVAGTNVGAFSYTLEDLPENTTYYVKAYATTSDDHTYYGDVITFTTGTPTLAVTADPTTPLVACDHADVTYTATMTNDQLSNYELKWYVNSVEQTGETNTTFAVHYDASITGQEVKCVATRTGGSAEGAITMDITVNPNPTITLTRLEGNAGDDWGKVEITAATNVATASWKLNDEEIGTWTSGKTEVLPAGDYNVVLTSDQSCEVTEHITVRTTPICIAVTDVNTTLETTYELAGKQYVKTIKDHEGNVYNVLQVGSVCWTRENMRAETSPSTGTNIISDFRHAYCKSGKWATDDASLKDSYGIIYSWCGAADISYPNYPEVAEENNGASPQIYNGPHPTINHRGICPEGWHFATNDEYRTLYNTFEYAGQWATGTSWQSHTDPVVAGNQSYEERNISGFSALPAGLEGGYVNQAACFWTVTEYDASQNWRHMCLQGLYSWDNFATSWNNSWTGLALWDHGTMSVRCVRNTGASMDLYQSAVSKNTPVTYTANIVNDDASSYTFTWKVDGVVQDGETSSTFTKTYTTGGRHYITCEATGPNSFTKSVTAQLNDEQSITTSDASDVIFNAATAGGNVTYEGYPVITERGVCYSTTAEPTISDTKVAATDASAGEFTVNLTQLTPSTTYHLRAYATSSTGTVYGNEIEFTTTENPLSVTSSEEGGSSVTCGSDAASVTYTATMTGVDIADYTLQWFLNGTEQTGETAATFTASHTTSGEYTVVCKATDAGSNFVTDTATINVTINSAPYASMTLTRREANDGDDWGKVSISTPVDVVNAYWVMGGDTLGTWRSGTTAVLPAGEYTVHMTNSVGCRSTKSVTIRTSPVCVAQTAISSTLETTYELAGKKFVTSIKDHEGNVYNVVQIDTRCWTRENMRAVTSPSLPAGQNYLMQASTSNCQPSRHAQWPADSAVAVARNWGVLYNKAARNDVYNTAWPEIYATVRSTDDTGIPDITAPWRGICPEGWHLAEDGDFDNLHTIFPNMGQLAGNDGDGVNRWTTASGNAPGNVAYAERNASGFSAVPAGMNGGSNTKDYAIFWTQKSYTTGAVVKGRLYAIQYNYGNSDFLKQVLWNQNTCAVRCIRDTRPAVSISKSHVSPVPTSTAVTYTASISGDDASHYTYTWKVDGTVQSGATSATFTKTFDSYGAYTITCDATDGENTISKWIQTSVRIDPAVTTGTATNVYSTTATVSGNVTSAGAPTAISERGICYHKTKAYPTTADSKVAAAEAEAGEYSVNITGLTANTTYHARAYVIAGGKTWYGEVYDFTTSAPTPASVSTGAATDVSYNTATVGGNVTFAGDPALTVRGICYNTTGTPTVSDTKVADESATEGAYTASLTGLTDNTTYYVRAYATNSVGTVYGEAVTFTTLALSAPTVSTSATAVTGRTGAKSGGNVTSDGGAEIIERGLVYGTSAEVTLETAAAHVAASSPTRAGTRAPAAAGEYNVIITGLEAGATYYVRAYATNSVGTGYGDALQITMADLPAPFTCGNTLTDLEGNNYATVQIGTQCWMAENLRSTRYEDCNEIALYTTNTTSIPTPARIRPSHNASLVATMGYLYNGYTVLGKGTSYAKDASSADPSGVQSICPAGWHIPSNAEWDRLANYLSMQSQYICGDNPSYTAKSLAATSGWIAASGEGECSVGINQANNNATGFNALPTGMYAGNLGCRYQGEYTYFWSTTDTAGRNSVDYYGIGHSAEFGAHSSMSAISAGFSIRCVLDE